MGTSNRNSSPFASDGRHAAWALKLIQFHSNGMQIFQTKTKLKKYMFQRVLEESEDYYKC